MNNLYFSLELIAKFVERLRKILTQRCCWPREALRGSHSLHHSFSVRPGTSSNSAFPSHRQGSPTLSSQDNLSESGKEFLM